MPGVLNPSVPVILHAAAKTFEDRNSVYQDNYKAVGGVLMSLFPSGITCASLDDYNRLGLIVQIVYKLTRYASQCPRGGHVDSARDICVYAAMLEEITTPHE